MFPWTNVGTGRMSVTRRLVGLVEVGLLLVVCSLVVGQFLGYPVLLGFVETGSMAPTLDPGDGFVAVPAALAGPIESGDVVTFRAEELNGGGLTTHRVVAETERGYVTRGDANPFTDQDGGEPPVKDAQVVAVALQVGGSVVVVPELGTVVGGIRGALSTLQRTLAAALGTRSLLGPTGLGYLVAGLAGGLYVLDVLVGSGGDRERARSRSRDREGTGTDVRLVLAAFALLLVAGATAAMVVPAGTQEYGVVSAEFDSERPTVVRAGETGRVPYVVGNGGSLPVVAYVEPASEGVSVEPRRLRVPPGGSARTTVALHAPPETGYYRRFVVEHRYLALLPPPVLDALYRLHPWAPIVAVDAALGGGLYLLGRALVGSGRVRRRRRDAPGRSPLARLLGRR
jgi:signal peptidase